MGCSVSVLVQGLAVLCEGAAAGWGHLECARLVAALNAPARRRVTPLRRLSFQRIYRRPQSGVLKAACCPRPWRCSREVRRTGNEAEKFKTEKFGVDETGEDPVRGPVGCRRVGAIPAGLEGRAVQFSGPSY